jgi:hypothetical protein
MVSAPLASQLGSRKGRAQRAALLDVKVPVSVYSGPLTRLFLPTSPAGRAVEAEAAEAYEALISHG